MSRKVTAAKVGDTCDGLPVYIVKEISGRNGMGVGLYRLGVAQRTSSLPFGVVVIDHVRKEFREVNRYIQRCVPMVGGADAINRVAHWGPRQSALQRYHKVVREISGRKH